MNMEFTQQQLYLMLGIRPEDNLDDITIIVKNVKSKQVLNEISLNILFEKLFSAPCNLNDIN